MDGSSLEEDEAIEMAIREAEGMYLTNANGTFSANNHRQNPEQQHENTDQPQQRCTYCGTLSTDQRLLKDFGLTVCFSCKMARKEEFKCISKSKAMKEYLLNDEHMAKLKSATVHNPNRIGWHDMKLYLVSHVKTEALRVWNSMDDIAEEKRRREEAKLTRGLKKRQQQKKSLVEPLQTNTGSSLIEKEIKRQRAAASLGPLESSSSTSKRNQPPLPDVFAKKHVHRYGPERPSGDPNEFFKECLDCGLRVKIELF